MIWASLARFFDNRAKKSSRGKAKRDKYGRSVRQRAFDYFSQGLRPSELPDMGVPMTTIYRYHQSWKHRRKDLAWSVSKKALMGDPELTRELADHLGVSQDEFVEALKRSRNPAQFRKKLRTEDTKELERIIEESRKLHLERLVHELSRCAGMAGKRAILERAAGRMGTTVGEVMLMLQEESGLNRWQG
jgi:hypothetical protein